MNNQGTRGAYAEQMRRAIRQALFDPFIDATIVQAIMEGRDIADWATQQYRPGPRLFLAYPGVGKTHAVVDVAEGLGAELPTLLLGLSHRSFGNVTTNPDWGHWLPHEPRCSAGIRARKGYDPGMCDCLADRTRAVGRPTFAPVEHVLSDGPYEMPLTPQTLRFPLWVFDEVGLDKFVDTTTVTNQDLTATAREHPQAPVRLLAQVLLDILADHAHINEDRDRFHAENWRGTDLYGRLEAAFARQGTPLADFLIGLPTDTFELTNHTMTVAVRPDDIPLNFAPRLTDIMQREWIRYRTGLPFNPLVHVVKDNPDKFKPVTSLLRIRKRKFVPHYMPSVVLDATADPMLLGRVFGEVHRTYMADPPEFPSQVHVRQLLRYDLGATQLSQANSRTKYARLLQEEVRRRQAELGPALPIRVGILTFESQLAHFKQAVSALGIPDERIVTGYQ